MAESSIYWDTNATGDGLVGGYTETQMFQFLRSLFTANATHLGGVAPDFADKLAVSGTSSPVAVATGAALVYGVPYFNTASVNVAVSTPAGATRIDRVVLRASWSAQTVRIALVAGSEGGAAPALTQSAGTTWEIPLAQVSITTGGAITVTDERVWLSLVGDLAVTTGKIAADAVTNAKIADDQIDSEHYVDGSIDTAHIGDLQVTTGKIAADAVTNAKIADDSIDSEHYVDGSIDTAHIGDLQVTTGKIADLGVTTGKIADLGVTTGKIADDAVTGAKIADYAIDPRSHISGTNGIVVDPQNGNARGTDAVDLQTSRSTSSKVASGSYSVIGGGDSNTASDDGATVCGGGSNTASGVYSTVLGGSLNTASSVYAVAMGNYALASRHGQHAHAGGLFAATGDAQTSQYVLRISTTNATPAEVFLNGLSSRLTIASDQTVFFDALIVARRTDADNESAAYRIEGCIDNNAGTTALVGSITKTVIAEDTAAWDVTASADNTNDALTITVTGETSKTIRWVAFVRTVEVSG